MSYCYSIQNTNIDAIHFLYCRLCVRFFNLLHVDWFITTKRYISPRNNIAVLVFHRCQYNKMNLTCPLSLWIGILIFLCLSQYFTRFLCSLVKYQLLHSRMKFLFKGRYLQSIFCIWYQMLMQHHSFFWNWAICLLLRSHFQSVLLKLFWVAKLTEMPVVIVAKETTWWVK